MDLHRVLRRFDTPERIEALAEQQTVREEAERDIVDERMATDAQQAIESPPRDLGDQK